MLLWERRRESLNVRATCETTQEITRVGSLAAPRISISCNRVEKGRRAKQEPLGALWWPVTGLGTMHWGDKGRIGQRLFYKA